MRTKWVDSLFVGFLVSNCEALPSSVDKFVPSAISFFVIGKQRKLAFFSTAFSSVSSAG